MMFLVGACNKLLLWGKEEKLSLALWLFLSVTIITAFVPVFPVMPASGLDPSWVWGMNQAVSQELSLGRDIIFTFGPYATIFTKAYHPATVFRMFAGSAYLAIIYLGCFSFLVAKVKWRWPFILCAIFAFRLCGMDALLFSVPLLVGLVVFRLLPENEVVVRRRVITPYVLALALTLFGLLPLVKGPLLPLCGVMAMLCAAFFFCFKRWLLGCICLVVPVLAMFLFWFLSGEYLGNLPLYLLNMLPIISGYSEAMAIGHRLWDIVVFILISSVLLFALAKSAILSVAQRLFLFLIFSLFLFVCFKAGFVRHDLHVLIAIMGLAIAYIFLRLVLPKIPFVDSKWFVLCVAFLLVFPLMVAWRDLVKINAPGNGIDLTKYRRQLVGQALKDISREAGYANLALLLIRSNPIVVMPNFNNKPLGQRFDEAVKAVNENCDLDLNIAGTVDIYTYDQACLFAKGITWKPRPVFQSYSAYKPSLIIKNEQHLRHGDAPDSLIFRIQTIDNRLPSLDDGLSWPAIIDNYELRKSAGDWVYLSKKHQSIKANSQYKVLQQVNARVDDEIAIPESDLPVFVEIVVKPTLLGKLAAIAYKPSPILMHVSLASGEHISYRVNANMMETGFFISPLVISNQEFLGLFDMGRTNSSAKMVKSVRLEVQGKWPVLWNEEYVLKFKGYIRPQNAA